MILTSRRISGHDVACLGALHQRLIVPHLGRGGHQPGHLPLLHLKHRRLGDHPRRLEAFTATSDTQKEAKGAWLSGALPNTSHDSAPLAVAVAARPPPPPRCPSINEGERPLPLPCCLRA